MAPAIDPPFGRRGRGLANAPGIARNHNPNYDYDYDYFTWERNSRMRPRAQDFDFPGVTPSRQQRSREMTLALLQAGAGMLRTRSLAELSIEALCTKVGATVGAFYSRFESKEAYFNALIELAARDGASRLSQMTANERLADAGLAELCRLLVNGITGWIRNHEGVLRAALQHDDTRPDRWTTFKGLARAATAGGTPALLRAMGSGREAAKTRAIAFGFQVVLGTLVNAILNDPGPLSIHDTEMEVRLSGCLLLLLESETKARPSETSVRNASRRRK
jgi:AcrR family transcriptional regulator